MTRSKPAEWLYREYPDVWDPEPEIFVERIISEELPSVPFPVPANVWAYGNRPCTKLYVVRGADELRSMTNPADAVGCGKPNDSLLVFRALADGRLKPNARGYLNDPRP